MVPVKNKPKTKRPIPDAESKNNTSNNPREGSKIEYAVDDAGIHRKKKEPLSTERAIEDVTALIREKLKSLPKL